MILIITSVICFTSPFFFPKKALEDLFDPIYVIVLFLQYHPLMSYKENECERHVFLLARCQSVVEISLLV